ncbi:inositol monophosphatase family protein [Oscillatoria sp. FACHB-1407]|uniref:inositol monophosphatase family protein n=1 Tax=Oscillatoria sp. FACHB-1407 TaxID=2692847 RepID=UPI001685307B|nr:inositol monophosphatase family protein [Oscillatoria sp. FACHB-1407]MBD2461401.1 inositol monophosphatase family protein [Oscillatoria sp. FACHB-1407]
MSQRITPRLILETLLPHLKVAANYARNVQSRIASRPAKEGDSFFATALSDADLSIQTLIEVTLLGTFPTIRFYGEEYEQSYNTKYFRAIDLGDKNDYLVTLDPIDGTQFYLDGHSNYQIILTVLNSDEFEAAIALTPAQNSYYYALRGEGTWQGTFEDDLSACKTLRADKTSATIFLGWGMGWLAPHLKERYQVLDVAKDYSAEVQIPSVNGILNGELAGVVLRAGKLIDGAALAFIAQEAGYIVTTHDGNPLPPIYTCDDYTRPGLIIAASPAVHMHLLEAVNQAQRA